MIETAKDNGEGGGWLDLSFFRLTDLGCQKYLCIDKKMLELKQFGAVERYIIVKGWLINVKMSPIYTVKWAQI